MQNIEKIIKQFIKFGFVGVAAAIIDFGLLSIFTEFFNIHYLISAALSFIIATIFNYWISMKYVFISRYSQQEKQREALLFLILSLVGLALNQMLMWFFVDIAAIHYIIAKVFATVIVMVWNFISRKLWIE